MRCPGGVKTGDGPKQLRGSCSCTMLDVRRWQTEPAYVRFTMDDGGAWQRLCTKYDVRCTMYDLQIRARCAGRWRRERRPCTMYDCDDRAPCGVGSEMVLLKRLALKILLDLGGYSCRMGRVGCVRCTLRRKIQIYAAISVQLEGI